MYGLSQQEWASLVLSVNTHRGSRRLSPGQVAELVARAVRQTTAKQLAASLGLRGPDMVKRFLSLNLLPSDLKDVVDWGAKPGSVSMTTAMVLVTLPDPDATRAAFEAAIEHNITRGEAVQVRQAYLRGMGPIGKCIDSALRTRPRIERREAILGAITLPEVSNKLGTLTPEERTRVLEAAMHKAFPGVCYRGCNLGMRYFSLLFNERESQALRASLGERSLEETISRQIEQMLGHGGSTGCPA